MHKVLQKVVAKEGGITGEYGDSTLFPVGLLQGGPFQEVLNRPIVLPRVDSGHYNCTDNDIFCINEDVLHVHAVLRSLA